MIEQDTIRLLRECDAGVRMGISAIEDVVDHVSGQAFCRQLITCKTVHEKLETEIRELLEHYGDDGKEPNPVARGMSHIKTSMKLGTDPSDKTAAALITDGCNMGVKSLNQYLNRYKAADEASTGLAKRLITLEEDLAVDIRRFL